MNATPHATPPPASTPARRRGAARALGYDPPDLVPIAAAGPVRRRHVFFVPGYDPEGARRYRQLFVRELVRYAKRFRLPRREVTPLEAAPDGLSQAWTVTVDTPAGPVATRYEVLLWADIVQADFRRSLASRIALLVLGVLVGAVTGTLYRYYRLNWKYGNVILYPFVVIVALAALAALVGTALGLGVGALGAPRPLPALVGLAAALGAFALAAPRLDRFFVWHLLHDWIFNWQHGSGTRPDYEARVDAFAALVAARAGAWRVEGSPGRDVPDEMLIVGHSSGALTAVEVAARALARDPALGRAPDVEGPEAGPEPGLDAAPRPTVSLATLGSALPIVALQLPARRPRAQIGAVMASGRITWVDFQAPQDWLNFPGFEPSRDLAHLAALPPAGAPHRNPLIRSARFRELMRPETYRDTLFKPFRMHFQFLMANDFAGDYDFFAMTLGPQRLRERVAGPLSAALGGADPARPPDR